MDVEYEEVKNIHKAEIMKLRTDDLPEKESLAIMEPRFTLWPNMFCKEQ